MEKFQSIFQEFFIECEAKTIDIKQKVDATVKEVSELILCYGEDESTKPPDFFAMFYNFAKEFSNCYKNIILSEKVKKEQEEKKKLATEQNKNQQLKKSSTIMNNNKQVQQKKNIFQRQHTINQVNEKNLGNSERRPPRGHQRSPSQKNELRRKELELNMQQDESKHKHLKEGQHSF